MSSKPEDSVDVEEQEEISEVEAVVQEEEEEAAVASVAVAEDDEEEVMTVKSEITNDDIEEVKSPTITNSSSKKNGSGTKRKRGGPPPGSRKGRTPAVQGLTIPFRAIKRTMKLDPDIGTVQNEAAIVTTMAAELFVKTLATQSHQRAKSKGRNTIRYEDVAEARSNDPALAFLETLIP